MRRMASSTPWVMDSDELGFMTRILVDWRRRRSVILTVKSWCFAWLGP